jgi:hypothetical protein
MWICMYIVFSIKLCWWTCHRESRTRFGTTTTCTCNCSWSKMLWTKTTLDTRWYLGCLSKSFDTNEGEYRYWSKTGSEEPLFTEWWQRMTTRLDDYACDVAERQHNQFVRDYKESCKTMMLKIYIRRVVWWPLASQGQLKEVWEIIQLIIALSHYQASVECRFSIYNENILIPNMTINPSGILGTIYM